VISTQIDGHVWLELIQAGMTHSSLIRENNWDTTLSELSSLGELDATAREFGAFLRPRGIRSPQDLLRLSLGYGTGFSLRQTSAWAGAIDLAGISDVALLNRISKAADWLEHLAKQLLNQTQALPGGEWAGLRIRLVDATTLSRPGAKGTTWRLHVSYDLTGQIDDFKLTNAKGAESLSRFAWRKGDVAVADRGYAKAKDLRAVIEAGGHVVTRIGWNALRLTDENGAPFDLFATLKKVANSPADVSAKVDARVKGCAHLPVRLLITRLPEDKAEEARKKIKAKAARQGKKTDPRSLEAAGYIIVLTSLPAEYTAESIIKLYRLRWQIELLFKRMKSLLKFGELPAKRTNLAKAWIFSKIIITLLAEKTAQKVADFSPSALSFVCSTIQCSPTTPSHPLSQPTRLGARQILRKVS
jgi:hypothetical protein